jgi:hypothetical protein
MVISGRGHPFFASCLIMVATNDDELTLARAVSGVPPFRNWFSWCYYSYLHWAVWEWFIQNREGVFGCSFPTGKIRSRVYPLCFEQIVTHFCEVCSSDCTSLSRLMSPWSFQRFRSTLADLPQPWSHKFWLRYVPRPLMQFRFGLLFDSFLFTSHTWINCMYQTVPVSLPILHTLLLVQYAAVMLSQWCNPEWILQAIYWRVFFWWSICVPNLSWSST